MLDLLPPEVDILDEPSFYTPDLIDATLRSWDKWGSLAEGIGSSVPDAHRSSKGKRYDPLTHADRKADIEKAMVFALPQWSLGKTAVEHVRDGHTLTAVARALDLRSDVVRRAYDEACERMAIFLGWMPPPPEGTVWEKP